MPSSRTLRDDQWNKILSFLCACPKVYVGDQDACRLFVTACLWMMRTGAPWRDLPNQYGNWNSVYRRFARWSDAGVWEEMHAHFAQDPDMEEVLIDSTVVRAHPCAAGAPKEQGGQEEQALGRSRGGFSSKIHIAVDGLGNPLRVTLTGGQKHDVTEAARLLDG